MVKTSNIIGVDLGATWVRVGISDEKGNLQARIKDRIDKADRDSVSKQIIKIMESLLKRQSVNARMIKGIGVASAGPLDVHRGELVNPVNFPFTSVPLVRPIHDAFQASVKFLNDALAGVLAEKTYGAAKSVDNCVYVTLSTGIGGGAVVDGHLLFGKEGNAHEIGHFTVENPGRLMCGCGRKGHWEAYCSGTGIPRYVRMRLSDTDFQVPKNDRFRDVKHKSPHALAAEHLFYSAKNGSASALRLVKEIGEFNAIGFGDVINAYDPSLITVGGAIALRNKSMIFPPIRRLVKNHTVNRIPKIIATSLGENVVLYGAIAAVADDICQ